MEGRQSVRDLAATFLPYCLVIVAEDSAEREKRRPAKEGNEREVAEREKEKERDWESGWGRLRGLKSDWSIVLK